MVAWVPVKAAEPVVVPETLMVAAVPVNAAEPAAVPDTLTSPSVPVNTGVVARAADAAVITLVSLEVGRVTEVGVLAVKLPADHAIVRFSLLSGVKLRVGSVQAAAVPAVTEPAPSNSLIVAVVGVTVMSGLLTEPAGVKLPVELTVPPVKDTEPAGV